MIYPFHAWGLWVEGIEKPRFKRVTQQEFWESDLAKKLGKELGWAGKHEVWRKLLIGRQERPW